MMNASSAPTTALPIPMPAAAPEDILSFLIGVGIGVGLLEEEDVDEGTIVDFVVEGNVMVWEEEVGELVLDGDTVIDRLGDMNRLLLELVVGEGEKEGVGLSVIVIV